MGEEGEGREGKRECVRVTYWNVVGVKVEPEVAHRDHVIAVQGLLAYDEGEVAPRVSFRIDLAQIAKGTCTRGRSQHFQ